MTPFHNPRYAFVICKWHVLRGKRSILLPRNLRLEPMVFRTGFVVDIVALMYVSSTIVPVFICNFPSLQTHIPQYKRNITSPHSPCLSNCLFLEVRDRCSLSVGHVVWFLEAVTNWLACLAGLFSALRMGTTQPRKHEAGGSGIDHGVPSPSTARQHYKGHRSYLYLAEAV